jgi:glycosyltransferase involved in cell wall biosynthesis
MRAAVKKLLPSYPGIRLTEQYDGGDIQIYFGTVWNKQSEHYQRKSDIFLIYTMFEYSKLPKEWFRHLAEFDGVIVPSKYCQEIFQHNLKERGIGIPVYVVPLGVNPERWKYIPRERNGNNDFNIIWQGTFYGDRKGGEIAVNIFNRLALPNSRMTIKVNPRYLTHSTEWDLMLKHNIRSIGRVFTQKQSQTLLADMDLSIYPSSGEGFGLIPLEHMATGLPVIVANNSGMSEFCDPLFNMPVHCEAIQSYYGKDCGIGYSPNEDQIAGYISWAYHNREDAKKMGIGASNWVRRCWSYERPARMLLDLIMEVANERRMGRMAENKRAAI